MPPSKTIKSTHNEDVKRKADWRWMLTFSFNTSSPGNIVHVGCSCHSECSILAHG